MQRKPLELSIFDYLTESSPSNLVVQSLSRVGVEWSWGLWGPALVSQGYRVGKEPEGWAMKNEVMIVALRWHLPVVLQSTLLQIDSVLKFQ